VDGFVFVMSQDDDDDDDDDVAVFIMSQDARFLYVSETVSDYLGLSQASIAEIISVG